MFRRQAKVKLSSARTIAPRRLPLVHRCLALALVFLGAMLVVWQPALAYDDQLKQLGAQLADSISKSGKKTVAVADFTDLDGNVGELGRFLAEEMSADLAASAKDFQVIDRTQLKATLKEHGLAAKGVLDPQTVSKLGDAAGVQAVVTGILTPFADHIHLAARVLDASNAAILGTATVDIPRSKDLNELLAENAPPPPPAPAGPPASAPAPAAAPAPKSKPPKQHPANSGSGAEGVSNATPPAPIEPSLTGIGSVSTDSYRVTVKSVQRAGANVAVTIEFASLSRSAIQLAMVRAGTHLTDETGARWNMNQIDSAGVFNVRIVGGGGLWRGVPLLAGGAVATTLTFAPPNQSHGAQFSLTILEFRPKANRQIEIRGLK
ncbi:MAG: FlgO family outer membrane protein [Candidatus Acidiferrales bacterium]